MPTHTTHKKSVVEVEEAAAAAMVGVEVEVKEVVEVNVVGDDEPENTCFCSLEANE